MTSHVARIVLAAQLAAAAVGHADPAAPPPAAQAPAAPAPAAPAPAVRAEDRALDHLDRGVAAYRAGDYARARVELTAASELAPDRPNPYRWLALTEAALGDCASALAHVEGFLSRVAPGDARVAEMTALRERCLRRASATATSPATSPPTSATTSAATQAATPSPDGAAIRLDAGPLAALPPPATPLVRRWWFWAAVGAVAITAAGATYELTRSSPSRLPPVTCDPAGCHP